MDMNVRTWSPDSSLMEWKYAAWCSMHCEYGHTWVLCIYSIANFPPECVLSSCSFSTKRINCERTDNSRRKKPKNYKNPKNQEPRKSPPGVFGYSLHFFPTLTGPTFINPLALPSNFKRNFPCTVLLTMGLVERFPHPKTCVFVCRKIENILLFNSFHLRKYPLY